MAVHAPEMPIDVDDETGVWTTDALPMLYVPRHFFVNNHRAIEDEIGPERYAEILYQAGYKSAYYWCEKEAALHGISGADVFEHYMKRLSQRGWGFRCCRRPTSGCASTVWSTGHCLIQRRCRRCGWCSARAATHRWRMRSRIY